ncbi:MAG: membrane dipeptidase [Myxococcota bacterium]|jgi:membrane dipeptidase
MTDHAADPAARAQVLGVSTEAVSLTMESEVYDLHNDLYVPARLVRFDPHKRHSPGLGGSRFFNQTDLPRIREAGLTGLTFDIATNPLRRSRSLPEITRANIARIQADLAAHPAHFAFVKNHREFLDARSRGLTACYIGIQGGQAFQYDQASLEAIPNDVHRITLVHLTNSQIGATSSPLGPNKALSDKGAALIEVMNAKRILVDLAHINRDGYMRAAKLHDKTQPLICTHTGVAGVMKHWRNVDDEQIRAVTDTGGVIGIIFHSMFLGPTIMGWSRVDAGVILDHMEHVIEVAGEHAVAIGTDYDGLIVPPKAVQQVSDLPRLVQLMMDRKWTTERIQRVLGTNVLDVLQQIRPD